MEKVIRDERRSLHTRGPFPNGTETLRLIADGGTLISRSFIRAQETLSLACV